MWLFLSRVPAKELMQLGAPPKLLELAQKAATDEIRHAQSAFSIANRLLRTSFQPAKLDINVPFHQDLKSFALAVLEEAAISETLGVLIASEQLRISEDEMIKQYLQEVMFEESEHSELAYETLRWCIEIGGEEIRELIQERLTQPFSYSLEQYPEEAIEELGILSKEMVKTTIEMGIFRVVIPSLRSLVD